MAREILESKKAFKKFEQIIHAQKGKVKMQKLGRFSYSIHADRRTKIKHFDNLLINKLARHAGCPEDKQAGVYFHKKKGDILEKGDKILTIYAFSNEKLEYAKKSYNQDKSKMIMMS